MKCFSEVLNFFSLLFIYLFIRFFALPGKPHLLRNVWNFLVEITHTGRSECVSFFFSVVKTFTFLCSSWKTLFIGGKILIGTKKRISLSLGFTFAMKNSCAEKPTFDKYFFDTYRYILFHLSNKRAWMEFSADGPYRQVRIRNVGTFITGCWF